MYEIVSEIFIENLVWKKFKLNKNPNINPNNNDAIAATISYVSQNTTIWDIPINIFFISISLSIRTIQ